MLFIILLIIIIITASISAAFVSEATLPNDHYHHRPHKQQQQEEQRSSSLSSPRTMSIINNDSNNKVVQGSNYNDNDPYDPYHPHWNLFPNIYLAHKIPPAFTATIIPKPGDNAATTKSFYDMMDGDVLNKEIWQDKPWSTPFHDIQGIEYDHDSKNNGILPGITKFKCMYDDTYVYIGAIIYPAYNVSTEVHYTERNSPIFHYDSDFEVFIDAYSTTHQYKELELNAINTVWNLLLNKPYDDGGIEHSGRITKNVSDPSYYEVYHQKTVTKLLDGIFNDHIHHVGALWTVEIALAYSDLFATTTTTTTTSRSSSIDTNRLSSSSSLYPPKMGDYYRINFSRVEKQGDINWTWQPQNIRWDPSTQQYRSYINMHIPDSWGYLYFIGEMENHSNDSNTNDDADPNTNDSNMVSSSSRQLIDCDITWPAKLGAMTIYYALHYYSNINNGTFTDKISDLILPSDIIEPFDVTITLLDDRKNRSTTATDNDNEDDKKKVDFIVNVHSRYTVNCYSLMDKYNQQQKSNTTGKTYHHPDRDHFKFSKIYASVQSDRYLRAGWINSTVEIIEFK